MTTWKLQLNMLNAHGRTLCCGKCCEIMRAAMTNQGRFTRQAILFERMITFFFFFFFEIKRVTTKGQAPNL